jgi:hypothetical protein
MSEERYRNDEAYRRRVDRLADDIISTKDGIRKRREQREKRTATVDAIMSNATKEAAKALQPVQIIIRGDPDTARLVRRAILIFQAMMRARAN